MCWNFSDYCLTRKQRYYFANKGLSSQGYGFSSGHVWMWKLDSEESWVPKNWCFWTVVLEKTLESPLDCKEIQPVHPEGDQSWVFFGRNDDKAETPKLWPPHAKSWLIGNDWCWQGLGAGGKGDDREWDGWMASPTRWTWVWVNSGRWWWTGRPGVLRFMGSQRVGHDWATELNWTDGWELCPRRKPLSFCLFGYEAHYLESVCWARWKWRVDMISGSPSQGRLCSALWHRLRLHRLSALRSPQGPSLVMQNTVNGEAEHS